MDHLEYHLPYHVYSMGEHSIREYLNLHHHKSAKHKIWSDITLKLVEINTVSMHPGLNAYQSLHKCSNIQLHSCFDSTLILLVKSVWRGIYTDFKTLH